jgi:transcriptional regulator with XRE-family HTH domain
MLENNYLSRLEQLLTEKGWSKSDFSREMDISASFAGELVSGNKSFTMERLEQLHQITSVNLHWLITGEGSMYRKTSPTLASVQGDVDELAKIVGKIVEKVKSS